jgi:hypothetical protein
MKTIFFFLFLSLVMQVSSQNTSQYDNIPLTNDKEYRKAEPQVILAIDYVYSTPVDKDNVHRKNAMTFIMKWMSGAPDYSFIPDKTVSKVTGNDNELVGMYFVCLAKYAVEKGKGVDREDLKYNSYLLLATYCENPDNNVQLRGEIKKLIEAKNENKLKEYLESKQKK